MLYARTILLMTTTYISRRYYLQYPNIREIFTTTVSMERSKIYKSQKCVLGKNHTRRVPSSDSSENYLTKSTRNGTLSSGTLRKKKYLSCRL